MTEAPGGTVADDDRHVLVAFLIQLGTALIRSGEAVDIVRTQLLAIAERSGANEVDILVFPTALMVQAGDGKSALVRLTSAAGGGRLRLDQVSAVYELAGRAQRGEVGLVEATAELEAVLAMPPLFGTITRTLGLGVLSAGFALALQPTLPGVVGAFVLGTLVGCALLIRVPELQAVMPVAVAFCVATVVFLLAEHYDGENPIRSLIPPLVILLPGAAITTGTMELAWVRRSVARVGWWRGWWICCCWRSASSPQVHGSVRRVRT